MNIHYSVDNDMTRSFLICPFVLGLEGVSNIKDECCITWFGHFLRNFITTCQVSEHDTILVPFLSFFFYFLLIKRMSMCV